MATPVARLGQFKHQHDDVEPSTNTSTNTSTRSNTNNKVPAFSLDQERYDQKTYLGRFRRMLDIVDPRTLLYTNAQVEQARSLLDAFKAHQEHNPNANPNANNNQPLALPPPFANVTDEDLWHAKKLKNAAIHPDTNEYIPRQFRMSGFVPFNGPAIVGALVAKTTPTALFFHWLNQTHNALVNYNNRNASTDIPMETFVQGYCAAVSSAMGVTFGLRTLIPKVVSNPDKARVIMRFTGLPSVMTAAALNVTLMRRGELQTGIVLMDDNTGIEYGTSQIAAKKALSEMIFSRIVLPFSTFCFPPLMASIIDSKTTLMKKSPRVSLAINASLLVFGFGFGLPATIAIFPQTGSIDVKDLEEKFHGLVDKQTGERIYTLQYNKGL